MKRLRATLLSSVVIGTWAATACSISDRALVQERGDDAGSNGGDGGDDAGAGNGGSSRDGGSGGKGSGGEASSGGTSAGGRSSGGAGDAPATGGRSSGGATSTGGAKGTGGVDPETELAQAILAQAQAACDTYARCSPIVVQQYGDVTACVERLVLANTHSASLPDVTFGAANFRDCAKAWQNQTCASLFTTNSLAACQSPGKRAAGSPCNDYSQCTSSYCRQPDGLFSCGACVARAKENEACPDYVCADGLVCNTDGKCHPFLKQGVACPTDVSRICQTPSVCINGVCSIPPGEGKPCPDFFCDSTQGLFCDVASTKTCKKFTFLKEGDICGASDAICSHNGSCTTNTCVYGPKDGEPCDAAAGLSCTYPAQCLDGYCKTPDEIPLCK